MNKIWVINAKKLIICLVGMITLLSFCFLGNSMVEQVIETVSTKRLLPIYSVETNEKKVALTFDCAWRSGRYSIDYRNTRIK